MPNAPKQYGASRATQSLNDNNPRTLLDNMSVVIRDGGVYLRTVNTDESIEERRVDSRQDQDTRQKGGVVWYDALIEQQKKRDKTPAKKAAPAKKEKSDE